MSMFGQGMVLMALELLHAASTRDEIREQFGEPDETWIDALGREVWIFQMHEDGSSLQHVFVLDDVEVVKCHICTSGIPIKDEDSDVELVGEEGVRLTPKNEQATQQPISDTEDLLLPDDTWWIIHVTEPNSGQWFRDLQPTHGLRTHLLEGKVVKIERGFFQSPEEAMDAWDPIGRLRHATT
jgi:hypothetical protein